MMAQAKQKTTNGFGVAALVLGIVACLGCWLPIVNLLFLPIAILGMFFGLVGILTAAIGQRPYIGLPISGLVISLVTILVGSYTTGKTPQFFRDLSGESAGNSRHSTKSDEQSPADDNNPTGYIDHYIPRIRLAGKRAHIFLNREFHSLSNRRKKEIADWIYRDCFRPDGQNDSRNGMIVFYDVSTGERVGTYIPSFPTAYFESLAGITNR